MVDVDFLILGLKAIHAEGANGLLLPGISVVSVDHVPGPLDLVAAYRIRVPRNDLGRFTLAEFDVLNELGMSVYAPGVPKPLDIICVRRDTGEFADEEACSVRYQALAPRLSAPGRYSVVLYLDRQEATRCDFRVAVKPEAHRPEILKRAEIGDRRSPSALISRS